MTKEHAQFFKSALEYDGEECDLREDYSGRGMMGKQTCGIVFSGPTILMASVLTYIKENEIPHSQIPDLEIIKVDNMGMDVIWY